MAIAGEKGVDHVMRSLLADFDILMECAGVSKVEDIKKSRLSGSHRARIGAWLTTRISSRLLPLNMASRARDVEFICILYMYNRWLPF